MTQWSFDSNILIDSLHGHAMARDEIVRAGPSAISRVTWIEVMSKGDEAALASAEILLRVFDIDEVDDAVSRRAAALRRQRPRLKLADSVILASAQVHGRVLITRNHKDFPVDLPGIYIPYTVSKVG